MDEALRDAVVTAAAPLLDGSPGDLEVRIVHESASADTLKFLARVDGPAGSLGAKSDMHPSATWKQYDAMSFYHSIPSCPPMARPRWMDEQGRFYLMDWIEGASLYSNLYHPPTCDPAVARRRMELAGLWLREFHEATARRIGSAPPPRPQADDRDTPEIAEFARDVDRRLEALGRRGAVAVHGDYHPSNLLQTAGGVVAIDMAEFGFAHPLIDAGRFCLGLEVDEGLARIRGHGPAIGAEEAKAIFVKALGSTAREVGALVDLQLLVRIRVQRTIAPAGPYHTVMSTAVRERLRG